MTASLTAFPSDMVFGVGLGCLVQMFKTHTHVEVISSHTHRSGAADVVISDTWDCFWPYKHDASFVSFSSSVRSRRLVDVGSCRIFGFVFGAVLRHCSSVPVQDESGLRDLSPLLLRHFSSHCTAHRVGKDPHLTRRPVWNQGCPPLIQKDTRTEAAKDIPFLHLILMHYLYNNQHFAHLSAILRFVCGTNRKINDKLRLLCSGRAEINYHTVPLFNFSFVLTGAVVALCESRRKIQVVN